MIKSTSIFEKFGKKLKTGSVLYGNPIKIRMIRKNQFHVLRSLKLGKMASFGNFARIASFSSWDIA